MSAALLRIAKLIPRLGGASSESESLTALKLIEKALASEGLSFTDAGLQLAEFVKTIMDVEDEPEIPAPQPQATNGHTPQWNTAAPPRQHAHAGPTPQWNHPQPPPRQAYTSQSTYQAPPRPQPPPPPLKWSQMAHTDDEYSIRIEEILRNYNRNHVRGAKEKKFLEDMYFSFTSGFGGQSKLTSRQLDFLHNILDRLPI